MSEELVSRFAVELLDETEPFWVQIPGAGNLKLVTRARLFERGGIVCEFAEWEGDRFGIVFQPIQEILVRLTPKS